MTDRVEERVTLGVVDTEVVVETEIDPVGESVDVPENELDAVVVVVTVGVTDAVIVTVALTLCDHEGELVVDGVRVTVMPGVDDQDPVDEYELVNVGVVVAVDDVDDDEENVAETEALTV